MAQLGAEILDLLVPEGADPLATAMQKENRVPMLMLGVAAVIGVIGFAKVNWVGSGAPPVSPTPKNVEEEDY